MSYLDDLKDVLVSELQAASTWATDINDGKFKPVVSEPYQEYHLIKNGFLRPSFGFGKTSFPKYRMQVNLFSPAKLGELPLTRQADIIADHFYPTHGRGREIPFGNHFIYVNDLPEPGPLFRGEVHHMQVLDILFWCQINPES